MGIPVLVRWHLYIETAYGASIMSILNKDKATYQKFLVAMYLYLSLAGVRVWLASAQGPHVGESVCHL